jgi:3-oxoacyl-[acyl-carrier protein] reductase
MDLGLKGKKAVVTGGSRGIGRAIAEQLADEGVTLGICARKADGLQQAAEALRAKGVTVFTKTVEVGNGPEYKAFITEAAEALGGLDIFVHNVSAMVGQGEQGWERSFQLDMMGAVRGVEAAQPFLEKSEAGSIIFIGTTAAVENFGPPNPYSSLKAALVAYTNDLGQAFAPKGIRQHGLARFDLFQRRCLGSGRERDARLFRASAQIDSFWPLRHPRRSGAGRRLHRQPRGELDHWYSHHC